MNVPAPHFEVFSEAEVDQDPGRWRCLLRGADEREPRRVVIMGDVEPDVRGERLELLSVVRGLEALEQPTRVTLITPSTYVREGIRFGLDEWRANEWRWESFGRMVPVKNRDLWQRIDRAMQFHEVECHGWRVFPPVGLVESSTEPSELVNALRRWRFRLLRWVVRARRCVRIGVREFKQAACVCVW
ncbi:MAG: hypothetical protein JW741_07945 [Sedimentisphaerales bacterium]|nr:hypothetical protein [Sedimentisphaerales bacterium]